ncbi:efflux RND transporter periplasmic adaptor subunit [uncultured Shewanella sp.]|uniref:efflux RND transporter periplasmic adaptor subunit n=1 Tax=uncultured Shewanella sp. TaxID=173975 RepID=UPI002639E41C|nr:efflux RND transporter periplasmic adaptor subunit [uncultured Shewanella sp.]
MRNNIKSLLIGFAIGAAFILIYKQFFVSAPPKQAGDQVQAQPQKKILYWVAPMDANYKRDKPGKSPMGMDLVPVYDDAGQGPDAGPGTIKISPNVVNNLGVRTAVAGYSALHSQIDTVGYVTYDEDTIIHIHPRVEGWIEQLHVKAVGDPVKKGEALYDLYSPELVNAQEEFLLAIDRKNTRLIQAAEERLLALQLSKSVISTLRKTKKVQQTISFYSPQNGVVEKLNIREGFYVKPGSTLMSIGNLADIWVEAEVFESQAAQVRVGMPVVMTLDYLPGNVFKGNINYVYPSLDAKSRTMKVRLKFHNDKGEFKPNMFAHISIDVSAGNEALLIPKEALIRTGNQDRVVLALGQGRFKSIAVTAGRFDANNVEILTGLTAGDKVVSSAQFLLDSESSKTSDFKRMDHDMSSMDHDMGNMNHDMGSMDHDMSSMDHDMGSMDHDMSSMDHDMSSMDHDMGNMNHDMSSMDHDMSSMDHDMSSMDHDMSSKDHDMSSMNHDMSSMDHDMGSMDHDMSSKDHDMGSMDHDMSSMDHDMGSMDHDMSSMHEQHDMNNMGNMKGMSHRTNQMAHHKGDASQHNVAMATGVINRVKVNENTLNISRGPIEKWGRPAATLDFIVSKNIELSDFKKGMQVDFTFEVKKGEFMINRIKRIDATPSNETSAALGAPSNTHSPAHRAM